MEKDTADEIGTVDECLYSSANRIEIAKLLSSLGKTKLLETELEDIYRGIQVMFDEHCIVRGEYGYFFLSFFISSSDIIGG